MIDRNYTYVGPSKLLEGLNLATGHLASSPHDIASWLTRTQPGWKSTEVTVTFIITTSGQLRIADRHSEHVACAQKQPVRSAGEMTFAMEDGTLEVVGVTNQSTGYCPEPESWPAVHASLTRLGLKHPAEWTHSFLFRLCEQCNMRTIVKDAWFECAQCEASLPTYWNFNSYA